MGVVGDGHRFGTIAQSVFDDDAVAAFAQQQADGWAVLRVFDFVV